MCSSDSEDDLITYGTPLEPLEEDEIPNKKPRLVEDQVVKDKQGRRRFHGAFTGGFSAGFFNTVGSFEGWTPSSFKSSKTKKQDICPQKPEDFMDDEPKDFEKAFEKGYRNGIIHSVSNGHRPSKLPVGMCRPQSVKEKDLSEFGIAPVVLKAKQNYSVKSKKDQVKRLSFTKFSALGNYVLHDLLKPVRETIGIQLLKKMGWKPGQGVGPRLLKKEKDNVLKMRQKTYGCQLPPGSLKGTEETDPNSDSEWENFEFAPNDCEPFVFENKNDSSGLGYEGLNKRSILSGHFLKKENESVEEKSKKFKFSSQAFGVGAFEEEDEDIYAKDDMSRYDFVLGSELSADSIKLTDKNSFSVDGILENFILETKKPYKKHYPLPKLPRDFIPHHKIHHSRFNQLLTKDNETIKKNQKISLEERKKVFKEQSSDIPKGKKLTEELISNLSINENIFKPFSSNPEKQKRYENYLKLIKIGKKELLSHLQPLSMTDLEKEREVTEFEKAALLFTPLSGEMEDRFLMAKQSDDLCDPLAVVEKYYDESDDRWKAAKINMFGSLTRKTEEWLPSSLLCKRFNVPEPKECSHAPSTRKKVDKYFFSFFNTINNQKENTEKTNETENFKNLSLRESSELKPETFVIKNESLGKTSDKSDLFKAIFLSSDEDEEKNVERVNETVKLTKQQYLDELSLQSEVLYEDKLINSKRNLSPPSGIFKNIDLELLSSSKRVAEESPKSREVETSGTGSFSLNLADEPTLSGIYGPKMPEKVQAETELSSTKGFEDIGVWVERKLHSKKKHKKKEKKSKKACYKSRHKHKKH